jgi:hypothetical protein
MSVSFYQWGVLTGGIDPDSGIAPTMGGTPYGPPEQFSGTLGGGVTIITFTRDTKFITIRNTDDTDALQYSFDTITWFTAIAYQVIQEVVKTGSIYLRAVAGTPTYEVLGVLIS